MRQGCSKKTALLLLLLLCLPELVVCASYSAKYHYLSHAETRRALLGLARRHRDVLKVETDRHPQVPRGHRCYGDKGCQVLIARVGRRPVGPERPQVMVVAGMSGGALPRIIGVELVRVLVDGYGQDEWVTRLVMERSVVVVFGGDRDWDRDLNDGVLTDFGVGCGRSWAARVVDGLLRQNLFRIIIGFRSGAGRELIGYPFGSPKRCIRRRLEEREGLMVSAGCARGFVPPDEVAYRQLGQHLATFARPFESSEYAVGPLNNFSVPKTSSGGNLADWAYAGSAVPRVVPGCHDTTNSSILAERMSPPDNSTHRALTFIISTGQDPPEEKLGNTMGLYEKSSSMGNGHVPRNVRAALLGIDLAEPYVFFLRHAKRRGGVSLSGRSGILRARWSVGGAFEVNSTYLEYTLPDGRKFTTTPRKGGSMWGVNHGIEGYEDRFVQTDGIWLGFRKGGNTKWAYSDRVLLIKALPHDIVPEGTILSVRAVAEVDQHWANASLDSVARQPYSHLVRSRTDESWYAKRQDHLIQGSRVFYSESVNLEVPPLSGWYAILDYIWEVAIIGLLFCVIPPGVLILCWRNRGTAGTRGMAAVTYARQRIRRLKRAFSKGDLVEEVRLLRGSGHNGHSRASGTVSAPWSSLSMRSGATSSADELLSGKR